MDTFCQSSVTTNTQINNANIPNERQNTLDILVEILKRLTLHSKINDSAYYNSDEDDAERNPKSNQLVATHNSDRKKEKSLILTLTTEIPRFLSNGPSQSSSRRLTRRLCMGLWLLEGLCMRARQFLRR